MTRKKKDSEQVHAVMDSIIHSLYSQQQQEEVQQQQCPSIEHNNNNSSIIDLKATMMRYDTIGHGYISRDDMKHLMNSIGVHLNIESLDVIYR